MRGNKGFEERDAACRERWAARVRGVAGGAGGHGSRPMVLHLSAGPALEALGVPGGLRMLHTERHLRREMGEHGLDAGTLAALPAMMDAPVASAVLDDGTIMLALAAHDGRGERLCAYVRPATELAATGERVNWLLSVYGDRRASARVAAAAAAGTLRVGDGGALSGRGAAA